MSKVQFNIMKKTKKNRIYYLKYIIVISIGVFLAAKLSFPGTADELGYLYFPAKFVGWDWSSISYNRAYFSPGVGILWIPFFLIFDDFTHIYKAIIILNSLLLCVSMFAIYKSAKELWPERNDCELHLISLLVILYPSNLYYMQFALSENCLFMCFCIIFFLVSKITKGMHVRKYSILLGIILAYEYLVHIRSLIVIIITIIWIMGVVICKRKIKYIYSGIILLIFSGVGYSVQKMIQEMYSNTIARTDVISQVVNTDLNIVGRILTIFTRYGDLIKGMGGTIFYLIVATNILIFIFLQKTFSKIAKIRIKSEYVYILMIFAAYFIAISTSKVDLWRADIIVYGRYMENIIGPVLLIGIGEIASLCKNCLQRLNFICISILSLTAKIVTEGIMVTGENKFEKASTVAVGALWDTEFRNSETGNYVLRICCIVLIVVLAITLAFEICNRNKCKICYGIIMIYWLSLSILSVEESVKITQEKYNYYYQMEEVINGYPESGIVYYVDTKEGKYFTKIQYLQTLLEERSIELRTRNDIDEVFNISKSNIIIVEKKGGYEKGNRIYNDENYVMLLNEN